MPGIVQHDFGNLNDVRVYPFADLASLRDADGRVLPEFVLNDCHLWWPDSYGDVGFVSTVTVSPGLVTMTFAARNTVTDVVTVLAVLQVSRPEVAYKSQELQAMQPGVGGWAAVGEIPASLTGVNTWRFDNYENAQLLPRVAQAYQAYPVRSLGKENSSAELTGNVRFLAGSNLSIEAGYRYAGNEYQRCVIFGLDPEQLPGLYSFFMGPCGKRPESDTCDRPAIRDINGVTPDDAGVITIEIDDTNGVLHGELDNPPDDDEGALGIVLMTPIDYDDVCAPVGQPEPIPYDQCDSSLSGAGEEPEPGSSGSGPSPPAESSTAGPTTRHYDFSSPDEVADFSLFEDGVHELHWKPHRLIVGEPVPFSEPAEDFKIVDDYLEIPWRRVSAAEAYPRALRNNRWKCELTEIGDSFEFEGYWRLSWDEILALAEQPAASNDEARVLYLMLGNEQFGDSAERGFRLKLEYQHTGLPNLNAAVVKWVPQYNIGNGWEDVPTELVDYGHGGDPVSWPRSMSYSPAWCDWVPPSGEWRPCLEQYYALSSSSWYGFPYNSSSSRWEFPVPRDTGWLEQHFSFRIWKCNRYGSSSSTQPTQGSSSSSTRGSSSSAAGSQTMWCWELTTYHPLWEQWDGHAWGGHFSAPRNLLETEMRFFSVDLSCQRGQGSSSSSSSAGLHALDPVRLHLSEIFLQSNKWEKQACLEEDFNHDPGDVAYALKYDADQEGWSNDFGTGRANDQFNRLPSGNNFFSPQLFYVDGSDVLRFGRQYLDTAGGGANHQYAILKCESTVVDDYLFSLAFKYATGNPRVGLAIGFQGDTRHSFWAMLVDIVGRRLGYGMHSTPHVFNAQWEDISAYAGADWLTAWHRLVVRVTEAAGKYSIAAWLNPVDLGPLLSSSGGYLTKTIPVEYGEPTLLVTNKSEWDGSSVSSLYFADGPPGLYVFGGEVRMTEFTASPTAGELNIVVANKLPWLDC
jgi:hypothetical protein